LVFFLLLRRWRSLGDIASSAIRIAAATSGAGAGIGGMGSSGACGIDGSLTGNGGAGMARGAGAGGAGGTGCATCASAREAVRNKSNPLTISGLRAAPRPRPGPAGFSR